VSRIVGLLPGGEMATGIAAIGGSNLQIVIAVDVAGGAGQIGVAVGKQEACGAVIEFGAEPTVKAVTRRALTGNEGRTGAGVRRVGSVLPIFQVAGIALCGEAEELADGRAGMAGLTRNSGMSAEERKTILMVFDLLRGEIPAFDGMALRAVGTHLAAVNVRVTIRAIFADVGEDGLDVALNTVHFFVHAAKGILGFAMVEFRNGADRAPSGRSVAILAGDADRAVGIARGAFLSGRKQLRGGGGCVSRRRGSR
jgi:hypothetical protein